MKFEDYYPEHIRRYFILKPHERYLVFMAIAYFVSSGRFDRA